MFSHVCWQSRVGDVQHSFTSAGGRCAGPQGAEGPGRQPPPPPRAEEGPRDRKERSGGGNRAGDGGTHGRTQPEGKKQGRQDP